MADFSVDIISDGGVMTFDPNPLNVPAGSLVSWNNTTSANQQIEAPAQGVPGTGGGVAAFETTDTFPGL
jgi:plastocyanin